MRGVVAPDLFILCGNVVYELIAKLVMRIVVKAEIVASNLKSWSSTLGYHKGIRYSRGRKLGLCQ